MTTPIDIKDLCHSETRTYFVIGPREAYYKGYLIKSYDLQPSTFSHKPPEGAIGHWMTEPEFKLYSEDKRPHGLYCRVQYAASPAIAAALPRRPLPRDSAVFAAAAAGLPSSPFPAGSFRGFIFQAAQEARWDAELLKHLSEILKDAYDTVQERARQGFFKAGTPQEGREAKHRNFKEEVQDGFYLRYPGPRALDKILFPVTGLLDRAIMRAMVMETRSKS